MDKRRKSKSSSNTQLVGLRRHGIKAAGELTGIPVSTIRRACLRGELRFMRPSSSCNAPIMVAERDLLAWLEACEANVTVLSPSEIRAMRARIGEEE